MKDIMIAPFVCDMRNITEVMYRLGWDERNGGNITVNITEYVDDEIRALPAISEVYQIGTTLPNLKGCYFYCKGTNMRMRDVARWPMENGSIIRVLDDCASYVIIADHPVKPTSELPSHLRPVLRVSVQAAPAYPPALLADVTRSFAHSVWQPVSTGQI